MGHLFKTLEEKDVEQHVNARILEIKDGEIVLEDKVIKVDNVVIAAGYKPNNEGVEALKEAYPEVYTVGDINRARRIMDAVEEGFKVGCSI